MVRLRDEQFVGLYAETFGVADVQSVFGVDEGRRAAELLAFGDDVQGERRLARRFGTVNFCDATAGNPSDAECEIKTDGPGGDDGNLDVHVVGQTHDRALAEFALDGFKGGFQRFAAASSGESVGFFAMS